MISICIPAYKHVALTREAAASVLSQDVDVELVVVDDFVLVEPTTDNLRAIESLNDYLHADKRVKCVSNERLLPIQDNWNKAVAACSGKYIKLMGADDRMLPGSIGRMHELIRQRPSAAFHGHLAHIIDDTGTLVRRQRPFGNDLAGHPISGAAALKAKLRQQARFKEPACNFYLKSAWANAGGYDREFRFAFDIHCNIRLMSANESMLWNEYLVELRRHPASDGSQLPATLALADLRRLVEEIFLLLGPAISAQDRAAGAGWIQYRIIELAAQRAGRHPAESLRLLAGNFASFVSNPMAVYWTGRLVFNRLIYGDVQQR